MTVYRCPRHGLLEENEVWVEDWEPVCCHCRRSVEELYPEEIFPDNFRCEACGYEGEMEELELNSKGQPFRSCPKCGWTR
jgi:hypothetical protein